MLAPWHLWVVGIVTLIWNGFGAFDYVATQYQLDFYMAQFSDAERAWFGTFPTWVEATWAIAIWGSVAGSLFLLSRSKWAGVAFAIALVCMALTAIHNFSLADQTMDDVVGPAAAWFSLAILAVGLVEWIYAREMRKRGYLE